MVSIRDQFNSVNRHHFYILKDSFSESFFITRVLGRLLYESYLYFLLNNIFEVFRILGNPYCMKYMLSFAFSSRFLILFLFHNRLILFLYTFLLVYLYLMVVLIMFLIFLTRFFIPYYYVIHIYCKTTS